MNETSETTGTEQTRTRKPRSDKGKKRERAYMATTCSTDGANTATILGSDCTLDAVIEKAASRAEAGQEIEIWQRVGKPRVAQMRLI